MPVPKAQPTSTGRSIVPSGTSFSLGLVGLFPGRADAALHASGQIAHEGFYPYSHPVVPLE